MHLYENTDGLWGETDTWSGREVIRQLIQLTSGPASWGSWSARVFSSTLTQTSWEETETWWHRAWLPGSPRKGSLIDSPLFLSQRIDSGRGADFRRMAGVVVPRALWYRTLVHDSGRGLTCYWGLLASTGTNLFAYWVLFGSWQWIHWDSRVRRDLRMHTTALGSGQV